MIIMKRYIAAAIIVLIAAILIFLGVKKYESRQTFSYSDTKIILDEEHD